MKVLFQVSQASPWSVRDFRIAASARTVSFLGDGVALTTLILVMHDLGHGPSSVAWLLIAAALPTVVLAPVAGRVADEVDSRTILTAANVVSAAAAFGMATASSAWTLLGLVVALQAAQAFANPTWAALTPRIVGEERTGRAIGALQMLSTMALVGDRRWPVSSWALPMPALPSWSTDPRSSCWLAQPSPFVPDGTLPPLRATVRVRSPRRNGWPGSTPFDTTRSLGRLFSCWLSSSWAPTPRT